MKSITCCTLFSVAKALLSRKLLIALSLAGISLGRAQTSERIRWENCLEQSKEWYASDEATRIADNVLVFQRKSGGWPKNIDMAQQLTPARKETLHRQTDGLESTIDNGATYTQLRYLAKVYTATGLMRFRDSFIKGFDYLLAAQYPNGGWPQFYPLIKGYYSHITFNDGAMIGAMSLLRDVEEKDPDFLFVDGQRRERARRAVAKGIECILKCQIVVNGVRTAWCAQHDENDFSPARAREYELPSLSGEESVGIVEFLMSIEHPSAEIVASIQSAILWFDAVKIRGIRQIRVKDSNGPGGRDKIVVADAAAPPIWARFYEIGNNKYFFCGRDGIKRYKLSELTYERRNEYEWLGYWPQELLHSKYPAWLKRHSLKTVLK